VPALPHEAYIGNAGKLFDDKGALTSDDTREFLKKFLQLFEKWIETNAATRA
jgi:chromate reductase